jgi:hypothetical protein
MQLRRIYFTSPIDRGRSTHAATSSRDVRRTVLEKGQPLTMTSSPEGSHVRSRRRQLLSAPLPFALDVFIFDIL